MTKSHYPEIHAIIIVVRYKHTKVITGVISVVVAPRGALQPSMGEILSRDVTFITCRKKIIVIVNIMGEIL